MNNSIGLSARSVVFMLSLSGAILSGCAAPTVSAGPSGVSSVAPVTRCKTERLFRLYFGGATPDGGVSGREWQRFVDQEISPRFASGFTIVSAAGQWLGNDGRRVSEDSKIVEILANAERESDIRIIASLYKRRFLQDAVLVIASDVRACFE